MARPRTLEADPLLGVPEIADLLGVKRRTVHKWLEGAKGRRPFPAHDVIVGGLRAWRRSTVTRWAEQTGRTLAGADTVDA